VCPNPSSDTTRRTLLSAAAVGVSALSGCLSLLPSSDPDTSLPDTPTGTWTQYGADGANTHATDRNGPSKGNLAWTSDAFTRWQPTVADGTVFTTNFDPSHDGSAIAMDAQSGTERWRTTLDASGDNGTVVVGDRCIVAYGTALVALDTETGERIWTASTNGFERVVADAATGTVLVASDAGLEAFGAANGEQRWETDAMRNVFRAPAVYDDRVFVVGTVDGASSLVALSLADGSNRWQHELTTPPESAAPVTTGAGVIVADDRTLVVHDRETGERVRDLRSFGDPDPVAPRSVAVDDGTAFVTGSFGVAAVDTETGTERWRRDVSVDTLGVCLGADTVVTTVEDPEFAPGKKTISAFGRESGERRWFYSFDPGFHHMVTSPPVLVGGAVFFTATHIDGLGALGDAPARDR